MTPEEARMIENYRLRLRRDWTRMIKRRNGVNDLDEMVPDGGVTIQVAITGTHESGIKKHNERTEVVNCDDHMLPMLDFVDYFCIKISWQQDYTLNVDFDIDLVWHQPSGRVLKRDLSNFTQHFGIRNEARMNVVIDCDMQQFAGLPKQPECLSAKQLLQQIPNSAISLQLALPGQLSSVRAKVPVPAELALNLEKQTFDQVHGHSVLEDWSYPTTKQKGAQDPQQTANYIAAFHKKGLDTFFKTLQPLFNNEHKN